MKQRPQTLAPLDLSVTRYLVVTQWASEIDGRRHLAVDHNFFERSDDRAKLVTDITDHDSDRIVQVIAFGPGGSRDVTREIAGDVATEIAKRLARDPEFATVADSALALVREQGWTVPCTGRAA